MKVLVAAVGASTHPSGVCRHAANLVRCLLTRPEISRVKLVIGGWGSNYFDELIGAHDDRLEVSIAAVENTSLARNRWYYLDLPKVAESFSADIVQASYPVPIQRSKLNARIAVSLHDLYPYDVPENFGYPHVLLNRLVLHQCLWAADAICCVSQDTLNRLSDRCPSHAAKAVRIYNSVENAIVSETAPLRELAPGDFILAVAQHRPNKNLPLTLRVFRRLAREESYASLKLLVIGNHGPETTRILALVKESGLSDRVILLQGLSDGELQWCYRNCNLLLSTSMAEGFGLPIAEAVLAGCRVVCSDLPVYREVSRDLCCFVPLEPDSEGAFTRAVMKCLTGRAATPIALPQFSMEATASAYSRLYSNLLGCSPTQAPINLDPEVKLSIQTGGTQ